MIKSVEIEMDNGNPKHVTRHREQLKRVLKRNKDIFISVKKINECFIQYFYIYALRNKSITRKKANIPLIIINVLLKKSTMYNHKEVL